MLDSKKDNIIFLLIGLLIGIFITSIGGIAAYKIMKGTKQDSRYEAKRESTRKTVFKKADPRKDFYLSFENKSDLDIFKPTDNAEVEISELNATYGKNSLMVKIRPGSGYPGLTWEVYGKHVQNWSNAKDFHFDVYNNTEDYISLNVKFKSGKKYPKKSFSRSVRFEPLKMNRIKIPIKDIAYSCNIAEMSYVKLFVQPPAKEIVFFIDNIGTKQGGKTDLPKETTVDTVASEKKGALRAAREGYDVFIASTLDKIFQDGKTLVKPLFSNVAAISMAKNEYEAFQIVVDNGKDPLKSVQLEISDLVNEKTDARIRKDNITWRVVGYVETKKPYYNVKFVGRWPDPLMPAEPTDVKTGAVQPFWVTVYIPKGTAPGIYKGIVRVRAEDTILDSIPLFVRVFDFTLPLESSFKTAFDFYPHITKACYPQKPNESKAAYKSRIAELNEKYIIDILKYRLNPVLNIDPLSQSSLGRIDTYRRYGLNNFSIGKKGGTFGNNWPKTDEGIEKLLPLYRTYGESLKINRMMDYHYIYTWDEGKVGNPQVKKITSMIHRAHPELKNMVCYHGFWDPKEDPGWGEDIDIWCFGIGDFDEKKMRQLQYRGMEMWMYASGPGSSGYPNLAIDFDSMDYRIIPWLSWKYDIKGFLYWCVNWWPYVDPFESASNTKWNQNGNGLLYYPGENGPIASLRLEIFRDGMEDYEYLHLLNQKINSAKQEGLDVLNNKILAQAEKLL
ncbi:MAG: DUF4091 domain-containing protein, partial [Candidatus Omnitrophica bacterium]|nr:DUF4091 domain-containing protein [Candidatus Omnitrophota bacterium]